jgi:nucleoid-associated protein YgaU
MTAGNEKTRRSRIVKQAILTSVILAAAMAAGCKDSKSTTAANNAALSPAPVAYQAAPQPYTPPPVAAQPVVYDSAQPVAMVSQAPSAATVTGGTYTVKKGDTLYSIAKSRYGAGKEYTKITAANPGLSPQSLKVGQTITIP